MNIKCLRIQSCWLNWNSISWGGKVSKLLITASERGLFLICLLVKGCHLMKQWLKFFSPLSFFFNIPTLQLSGLSPDFPPRPEQWRAQEPSFPTGPMRGGRGLGTEGAAQHAEIWRRQIRWQRHREALSHGPKGKFAVIKRKMRAIKWLLYSFSLTFLFYYLGCLHLIDERNGKLLFFCFIQQQH